MDRDNIGALWSVGEEYLGKHESLLGQRILANVFLENQSLDIDIQRDLRDKCQDVENHWKRGLACIFTSIQEAPDQWTALQGHVRLIAALIRIFSRPKIAHFRVILERINRAFELADQLAVSTEPQGELVDIGYYLKLCKVQMYLQSQETSTGIFMAEEVIKETLNKGLVQWAMVFIQMSLNWYLTGQSSGSVGLISSLGKLDCLEQFQGDQTKLCKWTEFVKFWIHCAADTRVTDHASLNSEPQDSVSKKLDICMAYLSIGQKFRVGQHQEALQKLKHVQREMDSEMDTNVLKWIFGDKITSRWIPAIDLPSPNELMAIYCYMTSIYWKFKSPKIARKCIAGGLDLVGPQSHLQDMKLLLQIEEIQLHIQRQRPTQAFYQIKQLIAQLIVLNRQTCKEHQKLVLYLVAMCQLADKRYHDCWLGLDRLSRHAGESLNNDNWDMIIKIHMYLLCIAQKMTMDKIVARDIILDMKTKCVSNGVVRGWSALLMAIEMHLDQARARSRRKLQEQRAADASILSLLRYTCEDGSSIYPLRVGTYLFLMYSHLPEATWFRDLFPIAARLALECGTPLIKHVDLLKNMMQRCAGNDS